MPSSNNISPLHDSLIRELKSPHDDGGCGLLERPSKGTFGYHQNETDYNQEEWNAVLAYYDAVKTNEEADKTTPPPTLNVFRKNFDALSSVYPSQKKRAGTVLGDFVFKLYESRGWTNDALVLFCEQQIPDFERMGMDTTGFYQRLNFHIKRNREEAFAQTISSFNVPLKLARDENNGTKVSETENIVSLVKKHHSKTQGLDQSSSSFQHDYMEDYVCNVFDAYDLSVPIETLTQNIRSGFLKRNSVDFEGLRLLLLMTLFPLGEKSEPNTHAVFRMYSSLQRAFEGSKSNAGPGRSLDDFKRYLSKDNRLFSDQIRNNISLIEQVRQKKSDEANKMLHKVGWTSGIVGVEIIIALVYNTLVDIPTAYFGSALAGTFLITTVILPVIFLALCIPVGFCIYHYTRIPSDEGMNVYYEEQLAAKEFGFTVVEPKLTWKNRLTMYLPAYTMPLLGVFGVFTTVGTVLGFMAAFGVVAATATIPGLNIAVGMILFSITLSVAFKLFYRPLYMAQKTLEVRAMQQKYREQEEQKLLTTQVVFPSLLTAPDVQQQINAPNDNPEQENEAAPPASPLNSPSNSSDGDSHDKLLSNTSEPNQPTKRGWLPNWGRKGGRNDAPESAAAVPTKRKRVRKPVVLH